MIMLAIFNSLFCGFVLSVIIPRILCGTGTESKLHYLKGIKLYNFILLGLIPFSGFILLIILGILILWYKYVRQ